MKTQDNYETIKINTPTADILVCTLNRPAFSNAFNTVMAVELYQWFESIALESTSGSVRCIVLTGAGERAFCAGGDLKERLDLSDQAWQRQHLVYERMARAILNCPLPVVGAINGAAYGGGCELVAMCDFAYASDTARFALTETSLGIIPGAGGTQTVARAVGERRAKELIFSATPISATQAFDWGLINRVTTPDALIDEVMASAQRIAANAPVAVRQAKQAIGRGLDLSLADGLAFEIEAYNRTVPTADRREGVRAFNDRRRPVFTGH